MYIEQINTKCLSAHAYYIESNGQVAIIDPMRDCQRFIDLAKSRNAQINYIFETHFHADFISGHLDLARKTGAQIIFGPTAKASFNFIEAKDNQVFKLGKIKIKLLHTPGHTLESSCFLILNEDNQQQAVFTGDTLFLGDVGRPDLAVTFEYSKEDLSKLLYHSIQNKLIPLNDHCIIYPGHGAGSQCGKNLSQKSFSTMSEQKKSNYALQINNEDDFVTSVLDNLTKAPQYFPKIANINKLEYADLSALIAKEYNALKSESFIQKNKTHNTIILDTRDSSKFAQAHIPGSINIALNGPFAVWVGTIIQDLNTPILIVSDEGKEKECIIRLARVAYENVLGFLEGGIDTWINDGNETNKINSCSASDFNTKKNIESIIDVRTKSEYDNGHIDDALHIPLSDLNEHLNLVDHNKTHYIYCKAGYRSSLASSLLQKEGYKVVNVKQGFDAILKRLNSCTYSIVI